MYGLKLHPGEDDSDKIGGGCVVLLLIVVFGLFVIAVKVVELEHQKLLVADEGGES